MTSLPLSSKRTTILLADDHAIVVEGLCRVLERHCDVVGTVADGHALVRAADQLKPEVVVADVSMPGLNGIDAARQIKAANPWIRIVFLSMHPDVIYVSEALRAGGSAYVLKSSAGVEIVTAIGMALRGETFITPSIDRTALEAHIRRDRHSRDVLYGLPQRQREVLQMAAQGRSTKEIAEALGISPRTVEFHRYRTMESLGLHSIAELVRYALRHHMVSL